MVRVQLSGLPWLLLTSGHWTGPPHRVLTLGWWAGPSISLLSRSMGIIHSGDPTVQYQDAIPGNTQKTEFGKMLTVVGTAPGASLSHSGGGQVCWTAGDSGGLGGPSVTWHFQESEKHLVITARATAVQSRRKTPLAPRWKYEPFVFSEKLYFNNT